MKWLCRICLRLWSHKEKQKREEALPEIYKHIMIYVQSIIFLALYLSLIHIFSSCDAFIKNWEQWIDSNIEYECTIVMRYENIVDQSAFERRIQAFELEIVSVKEKDDYITYNLFSHYPVDDQTLYMLCESPTVSVVDGDDKVILTKTDVLSIKMEFSSIAYAFVTEDTFVAFDQKYAGSQVRIITVSYTHLSCNYLWKSIIC